jgi:hypothetical protein
MRPIWADLANGGAELVLNGHFHLPGSQIRTTGYGILAVTLFSGAYSWQYQRVEGAIGDPRDRHLPRIASLTVCRWECLTGSKDDRRLA